MKPWGSIQGLSTLESLRGSESPRILPSVLPVTSLHETSCGFHRFEPVIGTMSPLSWAMFTYPTRNFAHLLLTCLRRNALTGEPNNVFLSRCSCMSPCRWDYIFIEGSLDVWRLVSEDSDPGTDRPFLLIDCTGWVVTRTSFQRVGTTGYSVIPAYGQILLRQRLQP